MTPEINDMPWRLHGQVKEVAENKNLTTKEAYREVIREGLENMELTPSIQSTGSDFERIHSASLEDRETNPIHSTPMDRSGWMYAYSFADLDFTTYRQPMAFSITDDAFDGSRENLHDTIGLIAQTLPQAGDNGFFAIQQEVKEWYGKGLSTFWEAISTRHERHEGINTSGKRGEENAVYICDTNWGTLCISLHDGIRHRGTIHFNVGFLTDGIPLFNYTQFQNLAANLGHRLGNVQQAQMGFVDNTNVDISITDAVTDSFSGDSSFNETSGVERLLIENPFYDQKTPLKEYLPEHTDRFDGLQAFEKVPCYLPEPHPEDEEPTYNLTEIACTTLDPLVDRFSYTNVVFRATTEDE